MNDALEEPESGDEIAQLLQRNADLEQRLIELQATGSARLLRAELKAEAVRAGMVDLDGLKLIDDAAVSLDDKGDVHGARAAIERLRRDKPWLFGQPSSSSAAAAPPSSPAIGKHATEMTLEEWRTARAELIRRR